MIVAYCKDTLNCRNARVEREGCQFLSAKFGLAITDSRRRRTGIAGELPHSFFALAIVCTPGVGRSSTNRFELLRLLSNGIIGGRFVKA